MDAKKMGSLIRNRRIQMNMTQQNLADRIHVSVPAISKYENGRGYPDISLLEPLADTLGISVDELLNGEETEMGQKNAVKNVIEIAEEQEKKHLKKRTWKILGTVFAVLLVCFFAGTAWIRHMQNTDVTLKYDDCVKGGRVNEFPYEMQGDCITYYIDAPAWTSADVHILKDGEDRILLITAQTTEWAKAAFTKCQQEIVITRSKEDTRKTKLVYFYNGTKNMRELVGLIDAGNTDEIISESVLVYDRGY